MHTVETSGADREFRGLKEVMEALKVPKSVLLRLMNDPGSGLGQVIEVDHRGIFARASALATWMAAQRRTWADHIAARRVTRKKPGPRPGRRRAS